MKYKNLNEKDIKILKKHKISLVKYYKYDILSI